MTGVRVSERGRADDARCPYCRDDVADDAARCPACEARVHVECLGELTRCTSLGCAEKPRDFLLGQERRAITVLPQAGGAWRVALRRALVVAALFALPQVLVIGLQEGFLRREVLVLGGVSLYVGATTLPWAWFETWDARRAPSLLRHALAAAGTAALGAWAALSAWVLAFALFRAKWHALGEAFTRARERVAWEIAHDPLPGLYLVMVVTVAMGLVSFVRLRGWSLLRQTLASVLVVGGLASSLFLYEGDARWTQESTIFVTVSAAITLLFAPGCWLVEAAPWRAWSPLRRSGAKKDARA